MSHHTKIVALIAVALAALPAVAADHELLLRKTDKGTVAGYKDTPALASTGGKYCVHDPDRPVPRHVEVAEAPSMPAPSDAVALFDGKDLAAWQPSQWKIEDGSAVAGHGSLTTKESFGDCQLHVEWQVPTVESANNMNRGNSGVFLMGLYELQIFDSHPMHAWQIYADGQAAAIYGQTPPSVNACRRPGQWQSFDIVFRAPVFDGEKLLEPARITVLHNGVLVHDHQEIAGPTMHCLVSPYRPHPAKQPLVLQGHGSPVRFRNVWIRSLQ